MLITNHSILLLIFQFDTLENLKFYLFTIFWNIHRYDLFIDVTRGGTTIELPSRVDEMESSQARSDSIVLDFTASRGAQREKKAVKSNLLISSTS